MSILETAMEMLEKHALCDHCLGRQFAMLGRGIDNGDRGKALKLSLTLQASALHSEKNAEGFTRLKVLVLNGFSNEAEETPRQMQSRVQRKLRRKPQARVRKALRERPRGATWKDRGVPKTRHDSSFQSVQ